MTLLESAQIIGNFSALIGAIAVLATLAYLSMQVKQAGKATNLALLESARAERREFFTSMRDSPYIPEILNKFREGKILTPVEQARLGYHVSVVWGLAFSDWLKEQSGEPSELHSTGFLDAAIVFPGSSQWWRIHGTQVFPDKFVQHVNQRRTGAEEPRVDFFDLLAPQN